MCGGDQNQINVTAFFKLRIIIRRAAFFCMGKKKVSVTLGNYFFLSHLIKLEVKVTRNMPREEQRRSRIIVLILNLNYIWGRFVNATPRPFYHRDRISFGIVDEFVWDQLMVFMNMRRKILFSPPRFKTRIVQPVVRCHPGPCSSLWHSVTTST